MPKNDYQKWEQPALIAELKALNRRKKYGLVWEDKPEDVAEQCREQLPVLEEVKTLAIRAADPTLPENLLIEGDNYHALSVLNYTHARKVDFIYIDPPYNTGAKDWKYNNNYVDSNDGYRHSKWISMMANRLALAKNLLTPTGFICCAIDHNELFNLGCLMDDIFGEKNRIGIISVLSNPHGRQFSKNFAHTMEFYLVYSATLENQKLNKVVIDDTIADEFTECDDEGRFRWKTFVRAAGGMKEKLANQPEKYCYPIFVSKDMSEICLEKRENFLEVYPKVGNKMKVWQRQKSTFALDIEGEGINNFRAVRKKGGIDIQLKYREQQYFLTHWIRPEYNANHKGTRLLNDLIGTGKFDFPKSVHAVEDIIKITSPKNGVVLDFFAGSGTTGHAVSLLNKEDGGTRRFILCTNNENDIAREVCQPRIKAITQKHEAHPDLTGIPLNLRYYKTSFVPAKPTDKNKILLTRKATEMLCMRESTFEAEKENDDYKIFRNDKQYTGIIYDQSAIGNFKKAAAKIGGKFSVYVFSFGDEDFSESFADMRGVIKWRPIPEAILRVYRRIFK